MWPNLEAVEKVIGVEKTFYPEMTAEKRE